MSVRSRSAFYVVIRTCSYVAKITFIPSPLLILSGEQTSFFFVFFFFTMSEYTVVAAKVKEDGEVDHSELLAKKLAAVHIQ